jgi:hypothetical protein
MLAQRLAGGARPPCSQMGRGRRPRAADRLRRRAAGGRAGPRRLAPRGRRDRRARGWPRRPVVARYFGSRPQGTGGRRPRAYRRRRLVPREHLRVVEADRRQARPPPAYPAANGRCRAGHRDADCQEPEHQDEHVEKRPRRRAREPPVAEPPQPARKHDRPAGGERDGQDQCGGAEPDGEEGEPVVQRPVAWANPRTPVSACRTYRRAARRPGAGRRPAQRGPRAVTVSMLPAIATATASAPVPPSSRRRLTKPARNYTSASTAATASAQPTIPFSLL